MPRHLRILKEAGLIQSWIDAEDNADSDREAQPNACGRPRNDGFRIP